MIHATPNFGILLVGLAAMFVLGLLALLVFLVIARHRMLSFIVLGFVLLFIGLPMALWSASRQAAYRARQAVEYEHLQRAQEARIRALSEFERQRAQVSEMRNFEGYPSGPPNVPAPPKPPMMVEAFARSSVAEETVPPVTAAVSTDATEGGGVAEISAQGELDFWQTEDPSGEAGNDIVVAAEPPAVENSDPAEPITPTVSVQDQAAVDVVEAAAAPIEPMAAATAAVIQPTWVQSPPADVENQPAEVLVSDLFETRDECEQDLQHRIRAAIESFAERHCRQLGIAPRLPLPIQPEDIRQVSRERFVDVVPTSVGPMKRVHQLVVFNEEFRRVLDRRVSEAVIGRRLSQTGVFSGGVLLLVGSLFGILKGASRRQSKVASA